MTFMNTTSIILKTESRGRVRMPPQRREELLMEFERSVLPATKFAALAGVRYQTFATWVQKYQKRRTPAQPAAVAMPLRFAEVVPAAVPSVMLRVVLPGGASIELQENSQVALAVQLIQALRQPC